ncbi:MAG: hypothetical protein RLZZ383_2633, partial [Pseudomonadota bacterium]
TFVQIQQPFSLGGEGWAARREATATLEGAEAWARRVDVVVAANARLAWLECASAAHRRALAAEALTLASTFRVAVEARATVGELSDLDVALARSREALAVAEAAGAHQAYTEALVHLSTFHPDAPTEGVEGDPLAAVPAATQTTAVRADVVAAEARLRQAQAGLARARAAAAPEMAIGLQFQSDGGAVDLGPMFTLGLPLWQRNQAAIASAVRDVDVAEAELSLVRSQAASEGALRTAAARETDAARARVDGSDDAILAGMKAIEAAVLQGELDVRDAVLLQRELLDGRFAALDAERTAATAALAAMVAHDDQALLTTEGGTR